MSDADITVTCKSGYNFYGQSRWHCNREAQWEGAMWGRDEEWPMCLSVRHTAEYSGIVGPPAFFGFVLIIIVVVFLRKKKRNAPKRKNPFAVNGDEESVNEHELHAVPYTDSDAEGRRTSIEKSSFDEDGEATTPLPASSAAISTVSSQVKMGSSGEGFNNRAVETSAASTPISTLKKKSSTSQYLETEGL